MLCKNPFTILLDQLKFTGQRQHAGIETFRILGAQPLNQYDAVRCVIIGLSGISDFCIGSTFAGAVVGKAEAVKIADKVFTGSSIENPFSVPSGVEIGRRSGHSLAVSKVSC